MTQNEFIEVTGEIEKFYDKELSIEQSKIWFDELKNLAKERYRQISREIYKNLKFMPKLADIVEINRSLASVVKKDNDKVYKCNKCNGTGIVIYTKVINDSGSFPYQFAARCTCPNGMKLSNKIPSITEVGIDYEI